MYILRICTVTALSVPYISTWLRYIHMYRCMHTALYIAM